MQLYRLAYTSAVARPLTKIDLKQILSTSILNNQNDGITGALCFSRGTFLQVLEGDRYKINKTLHRINKDDRHKDVILIGLEPASDRLFGNWSMAFIDDSKQTEEIILRHCGVNKLVTEYMGMTAAVALVSEMLGRTPPPSAG
jgi:hypothetical protein